MNLFTVMLASFIGFGAAVAHSAPFYPRGKGAGSFAQETLSGKSNTYCAIKRDSTLWCWGMNMDAQLGIGNPFNPSSAIVPKQVVGLNGVGFLTGVTSVSPGWRNSCAVLSNGTAACWGRNSNNVVGNGGGGGAFQTFPSLVVSSPGVPLTNVKQVEISMNHACALLNNGTVTCWGAADYGGMGDGTTSLDNSLHVVKRPDQSTLDEVIQISASAMGATCALSAAGKVNCWGFNKEGQAGNPAAPENALFAYPVMSGQYPLSGIKSISANGSTVCALRFDGRILCWGSNAQGQYGTGSATPAKGSVPTLVSLLPHSAVAVSVGMYHVCAVLSQGTSHCWGWNIFGQLGRLPTGGILQVASKPVDAAFSNDTVWGMATGELNTCALDPKGRIKCAGDDGYGQLGNGPGNQSASTPGFVGGAANAFGPVNLGAAVSGGSDHSCVLNDRGAGLVTECAGGNSSGQLGQNNTVNRNTLQSTVNVADGSPGPLATQTVAGERHSCSLSFDGSVHCWGANDRGQVRADGGASTAISPYPIPVQGVSDFEAKVYPIQITSGAAHLCALLSNGAVKCWGGNDKGQIGNGASAATGGVVPTLVNLPTGALWINAGTNNTCALLQNGLVRCWGENISCSLSGTGSVCPPFEASPVQVAGVSGLLQIAPGKAHNCALKANGSVHCWGSDAKGQLAFQDGKNGDDDATTAPRPIQGLDSVTALASGYENVCARGGASNLLHCWGDNAFGQVGIGTFGAEVQLPAVVGGGSGMQVQGFSTGRHSLAATFSKDFSAWGENGVGQLGNAGNTNQVSPVMMLPLAH